MCGLAGVWNNQGLDLEELMPRMNQSLIHRGPDSQNFWVGKDNTVALGHTRLAIVDISDNGSQPMHSVSERYIIVFNGEIYNHLDLRDELELINSSIAWRGHSDTETILNSIDIWGIEKTLKKIYGMFAMAVWDTKDERLYLARDRAGEKPLYYFQTNGLILFASEPKAFFEIPNFFQLTSIDQSAVSEFLKFSYVPDSISIFKSMGKVEPGSMISFDGVDAKPHKNDYWSFNSVISNNAKSTNKKNLPIYEQELEELLSSVIHSQMLSDVPIGSFLSGGIDSSLITMFMQKNSPSPIQTFSIGFKEAKFNESEYAADISKFLKTDHTEFIVNESDILEIIPNLVNIYDEPFADSSQLPTILLSKLARDKVTVALTGDGGDEVFGGYNRHIFGPQLWRIVSFCPTWIRVILAKAISLINITKYHDKKFVNQLIKKIGLPITILERIAVIQRALEEVRNFKELHLVLASAFSNPDDLLKLHNNFVHDDDDFIFHNRNLSYSEKMMAFDTVSYLRGDILTKVDRATMYSSLETRAPFLDKRVIEYSWQIPIEHKIDKKIGKKILRNILDKHIPKELTNRPKQGFSIPIDKWLRGELFDWADQLLSKKRLNELQTLHVQPIQKLWTEHNSMKANHGQQLWTILMLQSWLEHHNGKL
jgi:asparagine synthase (glutamine-hydrolysing)